MSDYKPGTIAVATVRGVENVKVFRTDDPARPWVTSACEHRRDDEVTDVRLLVVLDWMIHDLRRAADVLDQTGQFNGTVHAIREQLRPPEPTGLGAVVEDAEGVDWHRTREGRWIAADSLRTIAGGWGHINAVRILSEGVRP